MNGLVQKTICRYSVRREQRRENLEERFIKFAEEIVKKRFNTTRMKSFIKFLEREEATEINGQSRH